MSQQEINNQSNEGLVNAMAPYNGMINEVHVMLVYHGQETIQEMVDLLESHKYKVTTVGAAEMAMTMLSKGKERYDVMIINAYSPDFLSTRLLGQAVALDIISIFVCDDNNPLLAKNAFDVGAYLYLNKPLQEEMVKYLWQFVLKEKLQREKVIKVLENGENMIINIGDEDETGENVDDEQGEKSIANDEEQNNNNEVESSESNGKYKLRKKRGKKSTKEANQGDNHSSGKSVKRKVCTEWTLELHAKFLEAVAQLGEGRCYPKEILELMDEPGLTRMQVASHLQKCRNNNWRAPEERKSSRNSSGQGSSSGSQQQSGHRKFGSMPRIQPNIFTNLQQQHDQEINQRSPPEFQFPPLNNSSIIARGESSTQHEQAYRPQLPYVEPQYLSIGSPFNNPNFIQNNAGGFVQQQQQNGPFVGMGGREQGPIIGGTNYRPGFRINNGSDQHAQNGYNMNVNAAHLGYSGGPVISDMNENVTINVMGFAAAANANFQQQYGQPNMAEPSNFVAPSNVSDSEGTDSNDGQNCDQYFDFNDVDYLFQNLGPPTSNLPNEQGTEFGPVYSDDQVKPSVPFPGIANFPDDLA